MKNAVPVVENGVVYTEFNNGIAPPRQSTLIGRFNDRSRKEKWWMSLGILLVVLVIIKLIISGIYFQMRIQKESEYLDYMKPEE